MKQFKISFNGAQYKVNYITNGKEAANVARFLAKSDVKNFGFDLETYKKVDHPKAGLDPHLSGISLMQLYDGKDSVYIFDVKTIGLEFFEPLKDKNFVAHYGTFEIKHMTHNGYPNLSIGCSMLLSILVDRAEFSPFVPKDENGDAIVDDDEDDTPHWKGYGLDAIIGKLFDIKIDKKFQTCPWGERPNAQGLIFDPITKVSTVWHEALVYAALDAVLTYKIVEVQFPKVAQYKMLNHYKLLKDMQHVISDMELNGMFIDKEKHNKLINQWVKDLISTDKKCKKYFGEKLNLNSTQQLNKFYEAAFIKQYGSIEAAQAQSKDLQSWKRSKKTKLLSFDKPSLSPYLHRPEIKALLAHKKTAKLISTYGTTLQAQANPITDRIQCSFTLGETKTGRLSSSKPNLQNLPRESSMREIFVPQAGHKLIIADFNQIELRVAGEVSGDPVIRGAYAKGEDLHAVYASKMYKCAVDKVTKKQRQIAKSANFGAIYGMGAPKFITYTLAATDGEVKLSYDEAKYTIDSLWKLYAVYAAWCKNIRLNAEAVGFIRTPLGKMRKLHPKEVYTKAPNTVVQGGAFEVMGVAMNQLRKSLYSSNLKAKLINSVHDEIILEVPDNPFQLESAKELTNKCMVYGMKHVFPKANVFGLADAKICDSWGQK